MELRACKNFRLFIYCRKMIFSNVVFYIPLTSRNFGNVTTSRNGFKLMNFPIYDMFLFILRMCTQNSLFNFNKFLSMRILPSSCKTLKNERMELDVIDKFRYRKPYWGSNLGPFDPKLNDLIDRRRNDDRFFSGIKALLVYVIIKPLSP